MFNDVVKQKRKRPFPTQKWKRKLGNGRFQAQDWLETTVSNPRVGNGNLETENAHMRFGVEEYLPPPPT